MSSAYVRDSGAIFNDAGAIWANHYANTLIGLVAAHSTVTGNIKVVELLKGQIAVQSTVSARLRDLSSLSGTIDAQSNVTGFLVEFVELELGGIIAAHSGVAGNLLEIHIAIPPFMVKDLIDPYSSGAWLWLVAISIPGQDIYRRSKNTEPVVYGGINFPKGNIIIGKQKASSDGSIPRISLKIAQEPDCVLENIINESKGGRYGTVKIIRTCEKYLEEPVGNLEADYDIMTAGSDYQWVVFTLGLPNLLTQRIPLWLYSSKVCPLATPSLFKGVKCQYAGGDTTCTGLYEDCFTKGNKIHWGAEMGLDPNAVRL